MQTELFNEIILEQIKVCQDILVDRAKQYATDNDRLHNFKIAAILQDETQAQALQGMMTKHITSIHDMCNSGKDYPVELWTEKITDNINYLLLLKAVIMEAWYNVESQKTQTVNL